MDIIYNTSIYFAVRHMATRAPGSLVNAMVSLVAGCLAESFKDEEGMDIRKQPEVSDTHINQDIFKCNYSCK